MLSWYVRWVALACRQCDAPRELIPGAALAVRQWHTASWSGTEVRCWCVTVRFGDRRIAPNPLHAGVAGVEAEGLAPGRLARGRRAGDSPGASLRCDPGHPTQMCYSATRLWGYS